MSSQSSSKKLKKQDDSKNVSSQSIRDSIEDQDSSHDATDSNLDEMTDKYNKENFQNKKRIKKNPEVRHLFTTNSGWSSAVCNFCNEEIQMSGRSDGNLRTHLARIHEMSHLLLPSQIKRIRKLTTEKGNRICRNQKLLIDKEIIDCTIQDSRTYNDFHKPGMRKLLHLLLPCYKPCRKEKIRKSLKSKFVKYSKSY
jgi:hypothetical protein